MKGKVPALFMVWRRFSRDARLRRSRNGMLFQMRTKEPTLRITKWLPIVDRAGAEIPLEAECSACADVRFEVSFSLRHHLVQPFHEPDREHFLQSLQGAFERHKQAVTNWSVTNNATRRFGPPPQEWRLRLKRPKIELCNILI